jgi:hypothetical protein
MTSKLLTSELLKSIEVSHGKREMKELEELFGELDIGDKFDENKFANKLEKMSIHDNAELCQKLDNLLNSLHQEHHFRKSKTGKSSIFLKKSKSKRSKSPHVPRKLMSEYKSKMKLVRFRKHNPLKKVDDPAWKILKEIIDKN